MSDLERNSLASKFEKLEQQQQIIAKFMIEIKRQLNELSEQFKNRLELEQLAELKDALARLSQQLDSNEASLSVLVEVVIESGQENRFQQENQQKTLAISNRRRRRQRLSNLIPAQEEIQQQHTQARLGEYQLVFDRTGSRAVLLEALEKAQERLIIVCPWLNRNSIDVNLMQKFRDCLNRNCRIDIGWGHLSDRTRIGAGWRYNALPDLIQLEQDYPNQFRLKLLGTHEKFLVCDSAFAMLGSHNLLTSSASSAEQEVGIYTTDIHIIQGLINRFDGAKVYSAQATNEDITTSLVALADVEAPLDAQDIGKEPDTILVNPDSWETDRDTDDSDEDSQETLVNTEEFLRRYNNKERDFAGINLSGANLNCADLHQAKLNKANLKGADLSKANLTNAELEAANLDNANISQSNLYYANLSRAKLRRTNLSRAKLDNGTNLSGANLSGANLSRASL